MKVMRNTSNILCVLLLVLYAAYLATILQQQAA